MPTTAQLNDAVDRLRKYAFAKIKEKVPSFEESMADGFVTDDLLLGAAQAVAPAFATAVPKPGPGGIDPRLVTTPKPAESNP